MQPNRFIASTLAALCLLLTLPPIAAAENATKHRIILVAGEMTKIDAAGHHDYLAGCECLQALP